MPRLDRPLYLAIETAYCAVGACAAANRVAEFAAPGRAPLMLNAGKGPDLLTGANLLWRRNRE